MCVAEVSLLVCWAVFAHCVFLFLQSCLFFSYLAEGSYSNVAKLLHSGFLEVSLRSPSAVLALHVPCQLKSYGLVLLLGLHPGTGRHPTLGGRSCRREWTHHSRCSSADPHLSCLAGGSVRQQARFRPDDGEKPARFHLCREFPLSLPALCLNTCSSSSCFWHCSLR